MPYTQPRRSTPALSFLTLTSIPSRESARLAFMASVMESVDARQSDLLTND
jgi:hypothetical protein